MDGGIEIHCPPLPSHVFMSTNQTHSDKNDILHVIILWSQRRGGTHQQEVVFVYSCRLRWTGSPLSELARDEVSQEWASMLSVFSMQVSSSTNGSSSSSSCRHTGQQNKHTSAGQHSANISLIMSYVWCSVEQFTETQAPHLIQDALQCGRCVHLRNVKLLIIDLRSETDQREEMRECEVWAGRGVSQLIISHTTTRVLLQWLMGRSDSQEPSNQETLVLHGHLRGVFTFSKINPDMRCVLSVIYNVWVHRGQHVASSPFLYIFWKRPNDSHTEHELHGKQSYPITWQCHSPF